MLESRSVFGITFTLVKGLTLIFGSPPAVEPRPRNPIASALDATGAAIGATSQAVGAAVGGVVNAAGSSIEGMRDHVADMTPTERKQCLVALASTVGSLLLPTLLPRLAAFGAFGGPFALRIASTLAALPSQLNAALRPMVGTVGGALARFSSALGSLISSLPLRLGGALSNAGSVALSHAGSVASRVLAGAGSSIASAGNAVGSSIATAGSAVAATPAKLAAAVTPSLSKLGALPTKLTSSLVASTKALFKPLPFFKPSPPPPIVVAKASAPKSVSLSRVGLGALAARTLAAMRASPPPVTAKALKVPTIILEFATKGGGQRTVETSLGLRRLIEMWPF